MLYSLRYASDFINPLFAMNECSNIKRFLCSVSRFNKDFKADICTYYPLGSICNLLPFGQFLSLLVALIPALVALTALYLMFSCRLFLVICIFNSILLMVFIAIAARILSTAFQPHHGDFSRQSTLDY